MSELDSLFDDFAGEDVMTTTDEAPDLDKILDGNETIEQLIIEEREHELSASKIAEKSRIAREEREASGHVDDRQRVYGVYHGDSERAEPVRSAAASYGERVSHFQSTARPQSNSQYQKVRDYEDSAAVSIKSDSGAIYREEYKEVAADKRYKRHELLFAKTIFDDVQHSTNNVKQTVEDDIFDLQKAAEKTRRETQDEYSPYEPREFKTKAKAASLKIMITLAGIVGRAVYSQKNGIRKPIATQPKTEEVKNTTYRKW